MSKPAPEPVVMALTGVGVPVVRWSLPAELAETKAGPPISWDEVLAFHLALERDDCDWRSELAALGTER